MARFLDLACAPATCRCVNAADRGSATRLLYGSRAFIGRALPGVHDVRAPGRVHALGSFRDPALRDALASSLPAPLAVALRDTFEWYACRGAFFHTDAHYGEVLIGAWHVAGPARELVFSRAGARLPLAPGTWVVFDPFEPHAVLDPGASTYARERYEGAPVSVFVGFELELSASVREAFGVGAAALGAPPLSSQVPVNPETGAIR
jgi:hypothetical protein